jgi:hypothetical protein
MMPCKQGFFYVGIDSKGLNLVIRLWIQNYSMN